MLSPRRNEIKFKTKETLSEHINFAIKYFYFCVKNQINWWAYSLGDLDLTAVSNLVNLKLDK